jgi:hypothetical protein
LRSCLLKIGFYNIDDLYLNTINAKQIRFNRGFSSFNIANEFYRVITNTLFLRLLRAFVWLKTAHQS